MRVERRERGEREREPPPTAPQHPPAVKGHKITGVAVCVGVGLGLCEHACICHSLCTSVCTSVRACVRVLINRANLRLPTYVYVPVYY